MTPRLPPGPPPVSGFPGMIRVMNAVTSDLIGFLGRDFRAYGDLYAYDFMGRRQYMVANPDAVYEIAVRDAENYIKNADYTDPQRGLARFLGSGLLTSDGAFWKRQRKLVAPALHISRIEGYAQIMARVTAATLDSWRGRTDVNLDADMMRTTLEIVSQSLFQVDVSADAAVFEEAMTTIQEMNSLNNSVWAFLPSWVPTPARLREARALRALDAAVYRMIAERRAQGTDTGDLLSMLLLARDDDNQGMTDRQVRDELVTLFLAGHETTANTMNWTFYLLAQHPEVEAKLHAELDTVLAGRVPTLADLRALPYTEMVIKESMRLYPPAYSFGRAAAADTTLLAYDVPKGTELTIVSWFIHRDPRFWDSPEAFQPERFAPGADASRHKYAYIPFGAGARICVGFNFAMIEAQLMLAMIASRYRLRLDPGQTVGLAPSITLRPKGGLHMRLAPREAAPVAPPAPLAEPVLN